MAEMARTPFISKDSRMHLDFMARVFEENQARDAIVWRDQTHNYRWLLARYHYWLEELNPDWIRPGTVSILQGDFSPNSVAVFLTLVERGCIVVPLTTTAFQQSQEFMEVAQGEVHIGLDEADGVRVTRLDASAIHPIYNKLREASHPGLVLFSSGSTGKSKAAVHDLSKVLDKFRVPRHTLRTITFLLYDHIGGLNTMLYTLSNAGCMVTVHDRRPDAVLAAIEAHRVELLPASPTFINLILISEAYKRYDLSSLKTVTYGTEVMPESVLRRFHEAFPNVRLLQTYGLSEVGILRSQSKSSDSLWVRVGGEAFQTRVVDGVLHVKAASAMLGYLNAPSPFTEDGWLNTGDAVLQDGDYIKILGRQSDIINVGGEKVHPAEVESVIQEMDGVAEATVYAEPNAIVGNIVCARVTLSRMEDPQEFTWRLKKYCNERLPRYKAPVKVQITDETQHGARFKKVRTQASDERDPDRAD